MKVWCTMQMHINLPLKCHVWIRDLIQKIYLWLIRISGKCIGPSWIFLIAIRTSKPWNAHHSYIKKMKIQQGFQSSNLGQLPNIPVVWSHLEK